MIGPGWETGKGNARQIGEGVTFVDNSAALLAAIAANLDRAMDAVGEEAVGMVKVQMDSGYHDPHPNRNSRGQKTGGTHTAIRDTSTMYQNVQFETTPSANGGTVEVGSTEAYALFVHEGTRFLNKRPYIRDALSAGWDRLQKVFAAYIKQGL